MALTKVSQLARDVAVDLGEDYATAEVRRLFDRWTIDAVEDVLGEEDMPFTRKQVTITTINGTETYTLAENVGDLRVLFRTDINLPLEFASVDDLRTKALDYDLKGPPTMWWISGHSSGQTQVSLWPIPDAVFTILAYVNDQVTSTSLVASSDIPLPHPVLRWVEAKLVYRYYSSVSGFAEQMTEAKNRMLFVRSQIFDRYKSPAARRWRFAYTDVPTDYSTGLILPTVWPSS